MALALVHRNRAKRQAKTEGDLVYIDATEGQLAIGLCVGTYFSLDQLIDYLCILISCQLS